VTNSPSCTSHAIYQSIYHSTYFFGFLTETIYYFSSLGGLAVLLAACRTSSGQCRTGMTQWI